MFQTKVVQKFKTRILCSTNFSFFETRIVYQIMWKNNVERNRPQMTIWHMRIACWTPMATITHSEYVINTAFRLLQQLHERPSMLRYTYIAYIVVSYK